VAGLERTTTGLYFRDFMLSAPPGPNMNLWLFDFRAHSVNSFNRKRRHIGIRIIIRIIYYPINGYPDSILSVLSIPTVQCSTDKAVDREPAPVSEWTYRPRCVPDWLVETARRRHSHCRTLLLTSTGLSTGPDDLPTSPLQHHITSNICLRLEPSDINTQVIVFCVPSNTLIFWF